MCPEMGCVDRAVTKRALGRALKTECTVSVEELLEIVTGGDDGNQPLRNVRR